MKCKVAFDLPPRAIAGDFPWPPFGVETLWAEHLGGGSAKLLNSPFYAMGVSYLDVVSIVPAASLSDASTEMFAFSGVLARSHHGTIRIIVMENDGRGLAEAMLEAFEELGCTWETTGDSVASTFRRQPTCPQYEQC